VIIRQICYTFKELPVVGKLWLKQKFSLGLFRPDSSNDVHLNVLLKNAANAFMTGNYVLKKNFTKVTQTCLMMDPKQVNSLAILVLAAPAMPADCLLQCDTSVCQQPFPFVSDWETNSLPCFLKQVECEF